MPKKGKRQFVPIVKVTVTLQAVIKKLCLPRPFVKIYQTRLYILRGRIKRRIS